MKKSKIMMMSSVHVWNDTRIMHKEACTLADAGFSVDFYGIDNDIPLMNRENLNIHLLSPNKRKINRLSKIRRLLKISLKSDADFFHIHDPELLPLFFFIKRKRPNAICVYDMHENFPKDLKTKNWLPSFLRNFLSMIVGKIEPKLMKYCDHVLFAEESYQRDYQFLQCDTSLIRNYPTYVPVLKKQVHDKTTLIYVGSITEDRGIWEMLFLINQLVADSSNYHLNLIGPIDSILKHKVETYLLHNNLTHHVTIFGRVDYREIWAEYSKADIGLCLLHPIPNYLNSMATKIYEYMAASLTVIASNFPDWQQLIVDNEIGFVVSPFDTSAQVEMIKKLVLLEKDDIVIGQKGRVVYEKRFNWNTEGQRLIKEVYGYRLDESNERTS